MVICAEDRVATVLAQDESLIEVFIALSPAFERLRNPAMRRVMARLVTVQQAARVAGVDPALLLARLNDRVKGRTSPEEGPPMDSPKTAVSADPAEQPAALRRIDATRTVTADVREELRAGREPFTIIMAALRSRPHDGALCVRAIFEPVPLYAVMARQGLTHWTERRADDDWLVWFYAEPAPAATAPEPAAPDTEARHAAPAEEDVVVLDVRGLEPPEPMMRTLVALEQLPRGATLVQLNVRVPRFLLPLLEERGFSYEIREQDADLVRLFIRRKTDTHN